MKRFVRDIFTLAAAGPHGRAEWTLHWLLAAAIMLPLLIFTVASVLSYREHMADGRDRTQRNLGIVYEHAVKVLETIELASRYLDELLDDVSDEQIKTNEAEFHRRLKVLTDTSPQFADIWIIDRDGHPLASGTVYPMPALDLSDRNYFRAQKNGETDGFFVGSVITARATNERGQPRFFALSRKRVGKNGEFLGVNTISISPEYFTDYYATLVQPLVATLIRDDGYVLARYPRGDHRNRSPLAARRIHAATARRQGERDDRGSLGDGRSGALVRLPQASPHRHLRGGGHRFRRNPRCMARKYVAPSHLRRSGDRRADRALADGPRANAARSGSQ